MKACSLDTLARDPEQPVAAECFLTFEAKALRECREALSGAGGVSDAYSYAEANPHPRLWRLVGEAALEKLELTVAEKALVQCEDYLGIQHDKKLKLIDATKQAAEAERLAGIKGEEARVVAAPALEAAASSLSADRCGLCPAPCPTAAARSRTR